MAYRRALLLFPCFVSVCFDIYDREGVGAINMEQLRSVLSCVMQAQDSAESQEDDGSLDQEGKLHFFLLVDVRWAKSDVKSPAADLAHAPGPRVTYRIAKVFSNGIK